MKIRITFKDPDAVEYAFEEARVEMKDYEHKLARFFEYNEYVTIEFDLESGAAKVLENF